MTRSENDPTTAGVFGLLATSLSLCCGIPILLGTGVLVGVAGLAVGSLIVVTAGIAIALWALGRRRNKACAIPQERPTADTGSR